MRIIRIVLQALIAALYGLVLLKPPFDLGTFLGISAFFVFLFLLTLLLREHTESRLVVGRSISPRVVGFFLAFAGLGLCYLSLRLATGQSFPATRRGEIFSAIVDLVGPWPPAVIFAALGFQMMFFGYRAFRAEQA